MGRFMLLGTAVAIALWPACRHERREQASSPKATEPTETAQEEAEEALAEALEAKETAEAALETAREAQAVAGVKQSALIEADRISVAGRITETDGQRVVVAPAAGEPLAVRVDAATRVVVDGRAASAAQLAPGNQVRLLYRLDGAQLVAERLDAARVPQSSQTSVQPSDAPPLVTPPAGREPGAEALAPPPVSPPAWEDPEDRRP